ncbi:hypothetical protein INT45_006169 [Circinella minor]|uniref:F-box domain-containing protein n=1 Tax=Circinella minor TaxID=1195481 RepID=A0A8H7S266_9FUNG|nr:hypothetical protein INT45_006169 [Circinella minor]
MGHERENAYDTIYSIFKDITTVSSLTTKSKKKNKKQQKKKSGGFTQVPTLKTVEEYLAYGHNYEQQNDHLAALIIYNQGLLSLTPPSLSSLIDDDEEDDDSHPYVQLEKAKQKVLIILMKRIEGFSWSSFPNEVVSMIFDSLELGDLLTCANVCSEWFEFIMDSPEFWKRIATEMPEMKKLSLEPLLRQHTQKFELQGPMGVQALEDLFLFLTQISLAPEGSSSLTASSDNCYSIQELSFKDIQMTDNAILLLEEALRSIGPALKRVEICNCDISDKQVFKLMARSCSNVSHISYTHMAIRNTGETPNYSYAFPHFTDTSKKPWNISFNNLTYLKVMPLTSLQDYMGGTSFDYFRFEAFEDLSRIIRRSPHLRELILDTLVRLKYGFSVALKHCPNIENIMVTSDEKLQPIITTTSITDYKDSNNEDDDYKDVDTKTTIATKSAAKEKGLRKLILVKPRGLKFGIEDKGESFGIFKKHHKTLEILYLRCDLHCKLFIELSSFGGPELREINLSFLVDGVSRKECHNAMVMLFSKCPKLEAITIDSREPGRMYCTTRVHSLPGGSNEVLMTMGKNCPRLQYLSIRDEKFPLGYHDIESFILTAEEGGKSCKLTYLEASINKESMLEIVQRLKKLRTLRIPDDKPDLPVNHKYVEGHKEKVQQILSERGGTLILDPYPTY